MERRSLGEKLLRMGSRDGWRCHLCGRAVDRRAKGDAAPTLDHVRPRSLGGNNSAKNLRLAHRRCNGDRGVQPVGEFRARLREERGEERVLTDRQKDLRERRLRREEILRRMRGEA